jgi:hypothetical protein
MAPLVITAGPVILTLNAPFAYLIVRLAAGQITPYGALRDIDETEIPRAAYRSLELQVGDAMIPVGQWSAAGSPAYQDTTMQLSLDTCLSALSAAQVDTITKALQQLASHLGSAISARQAVSVWRNMNQLLAHFESVENIGR